MVYINKKLGSFQKILHKKKKKKTESEGVTNYREWNSNFFFKNRNEDVVLISLDIGE